MDENRVEEQQETRRQGRKKGWLEPAGMWAEHGMVQRQESQLCAPRHEMTFDDRRSQHRIIDNLCKLASPLTGT